jgi:hypothetical protein
VFNQTSSKDRRLSPDAILFIVLWSAQLWSADFSGSFFPSRQSNVALVLHLTRVLAFDPMASLLVIALIAYLAADLYLSALDSFQSARSYLDYHNCVFDCADHGSYLLSSQ